MNTLNAISQKLFGRIRFCGLNGAFIGIIAGLLVGLLLFEHSPTNTNYALSEIVVIVLAIILASWVFVLLVVGVWMRYGAGQIAMPLLLNAAITGTLTVLGNMLINNIALAVPFGWLIGTLVGTLLCWLCSRGYLTMQGLNHVR